MTTAKLERPTWMCKWMLQKHGARLNGEQRENINRMNRTGKRSWIIYHVDAVNHDAFTRQENGCPCSYAGENPPRPMKRVRVTADGFTQIDLEVVETGLTILYNTAFAEEVAHQYPENVAWRFPGFKQGRTVTWDKLEQHFNAYILISRMRGVAGGSESKFTFNPRTNIITCKGPSGLVVRIPNYDEK